MNEIKVWPEPFSEMLPTALKAKAAKLFMIHQLPDTIEEWTERREMLIEKIWDNLGTKPDHDLPLETQITGETKMDGYTVKNVVYQSRKDFLVTGNLYVPDGAGPFPGVLNMHGHWQQGRLAEQVQSRGHTLAKNGYVCLCVDAFGSGERTTKHCEFEYHGGHIGASLLDVGETLMGMQVVDNMRAIDILSSLNFVDSDAIGATGASGGGNQTMWVSALDDRIKASVPVVSVGSFQSYVMGSNCVCEVLPNGLTFMEESGLMALTAPRALKICNALGDSNPTFFPSEMLRTFKELKKVYQAYDAYDKLSYQIFNLPHGYWPEVRESAIGWFDRILKNEGCGLPKREIPFSPLPEETVRCFPKGKRDEKVMNINDFCKEAADKQKATILTCESIDAKAKSKELELLLKLDTTREISEFHRHGKVKVGDAEWTKATLESSDDLLIPLLICEPKQGCGEYAIIANTAEKNTLLESELVAEHQKRDVGIILPDLCGLGETAQPSDDNVAFMKDHIIARAFMWLGHTVTGKWVEQLYILKSLAENELGASKVSLVGYAEIGLAAIFAEAVFGGFSSVTANRAPASYKVGKATTKLSMGVHVPKILKWGDVSLAAAICATEVEFIDPISMDGDPLDENAKLAFDAELAHFKRVTRV